MCFGLFSGVFSLRTSKTSKPLPAPRNVSRTLVNISRIDPNSDDRFDDKNSLFLFQVGQILDHDFAFSPRFPGRKIIKVFFEISFKLAALNKTFWLIRIFYNTACTWCLFISSSFFLSDELPCECNDTSQSNACEPIDLEEGHTFGECIPFKRSIPIFNDGCTFGDELKKENIYVL